jgi:hypothetical protein
MAPVIAVIAGVTGATVAIGIGSGLGASSRTLTFRLDILLLTDKIDVIEQL